VFVVQAEDGIGDGLVTGVQTCALPIYGRGQLALPRHRLGRQPVRVGLTRDPRPGRCGRRPARLVPAGRTTSRRAAHPAPALEQQIGRASCRDSDETKALSTALADTDVE